MSEILDLSLCALAGVGVGVFFFGGLWWTVQKVVLSPHPVAWLLGGGLLRTGVALAGFYLIAGGHWQRLLACLAGFLIARLAVTWLTRVKGQRRTTPVKESVRAS